MNEPKKTDGDEVLRLDEMHESSRPLTTNLEPISSMNPRAAFFSDTDSDTNYLRTRRSSFATEIDDFDEKSDVKPLPASVSIGFENRNGPELSPGWIDSRFPSPIPPVQLVATPDVNIYQHKKTLAQGMMDLALLSANANQMRYVLQTDGQHPYFYPSLTMISMSLFLQIAVGIGLIWNSVYNVKKDDEMCKANKANNWTVIGIFLVTILNVFISSFGVVDHIQTTAAT
ncbi:ninjurin-1 [Linepithema humile]|uniref:ninjurin-1 n=1 Tax=Linepithema humile TaxID=83485 RepID=UPI0006234E86|nr:PREDICTED: ninjurin-1 [Linepithema humile]